MMRKICFFDLDNTLLDNELTEIPASALLGLKLLRERGHIIALATGRDMDTHYSVRYRDEVRADATIHQNGTRISIGDRDIFIHYMDHEFIREIYDFCKDEHICVGTSIGDEDFYLYPELKTRSDLAFKRRSVRNFVPFEEIFTRNLPVNALSMSGDMDRVVPIVEGRFRELRLYRFPSNFGADVVEKEFSKAAGMKRVADYFNVAMSDTFAFGDSDNDVSILNAAGTGVAIGGAKPAALKAADYVTDDIRHDGIYNALKHFDLI